jgi:hypothetical protein
MTHPSDADGKVPQRFFDPNREEPSDRIAAVNRYFPL